MGCSINTRLIPNVNPVGYTSFRLRILYSITMSVVINKHNCCGICHWCIYSCLYSVYNQTPLCKLSSGVHSEDNIFGQKEWYRLAYRWRCYKQSIENDRGHQWPKVHISRGSRISMGSAIEGFHHFNVVNWLGLPTELSDPSWRPCWRYVQWGHQDGSAKCEEEN